MSTIPGISPITPDIEEVRHADEDGLFGDESGAAASPEETDAADEEARRTVEKDRERVAGS